MEKQPSDPNIMPEIKVFSLREVASRVLDYTVLGRLPRGERQ